MGRGGAKDDGISGYLIWSETLKVLKFNLLVNFGEVRMTQLAKSTLLTPTFGPLGSFQIFEGLFRC